MRLVRTLPLGSKLYLVLWDGVPIMWFSVHPKLGERRVVTALLEQITT
jgi:hypothetical protein